MTENALPVGSLRTATRPTGRSNGGTETAPPSSSARAAVASVSAMVANESDQPLSNVAVAFYEGDPQAGGTLLGEVTTIASIAARGSETVSLDLGVQAAASGPLVASAPASASMASGAPGSASAEHPASAIASVSASAGRERAPIGGRSMSGRCPDGRWRVKSADVTELSEASAVRSTSGGSHFGRS